MRPGQSPWVRWRVPLGPARADHPFVHGPLGRFGLPKSAPERRFVIAVRLTVGYGAGRAARGDLGFA
jgi:hypothetical protein